MSVRRPSQAEELAFHKAGREWPFRAHRTQAEIIAAEEAERRRVDDAVTRRLDRMGRCDE